MSADDARSVCCKRMDVAGRITWCARPDGHDGPHAGVTPRELASNTFAPRSK